MNVLVTASARFAITSDGILWTPNASLVYDFWTRYLEVYEEVHLLVRAKFYSAPPIGWKMASGPAIKAIPVPYFIGPWEFAIKYMSIRKTIRKAVTEAEAMQLRIPCTIGDEVWRLLSSQRPYGVEVVADPYDTFAPGSVKHPLRPYFRWSSPRQLRSQCANATAATYVTKYALQQRYPPAKKSFSTYYSDVDLPEWAFVSSSRSPKIDSKFTLISVGTLAQLYKAPDILIEAIAVCIKEGLDLELVWVGDGKHRPELEQQASKLNIDEHVHFLGQLSAGHAVRQQLDKADLFILPSYQEGLPRAMIEAMARALPCIGSTVGGFPELLASEDMVPPGNVAALASKICEVVKDSDRMALMSARNLKKAKDYTEELLRERRVAFYSYVKDRTEAWLKTQEL